MRGHSQDNFRTVIVADFNLAKGWIVQLRKLPQAVGLEGCICLQYDPLVVMVLCPKDSLFASLEPSHSAGAALQVFQQSIANQELQNATAITAEEFELKCPPPRCDPQMLRDLALVLIANVFPEDLLRQAYLPTLAALHDLFEEPIQVLESLRDDALGRIIAIEQTVGFLPCLIRARHRAEACRMLDSVDKKSQLLLLKVADRFAGHLRRPLLGAQKALWKHFRSLSLQPDLLRAVDVDGRREKMF